MTRMNLNAVRGRDDWYLGLIVRGDQWTVPVNRHSDRATFQFTMDPPFSMAEVHEEAVRRIAIWELEEPPLIEGDTPTTERQDQ